MNKSTGHTIKGISPGRGENQREKSKVPTASEPILYYTWLWSGPSLSVHWPCTTWTSNWPWVFICKLFHFWGSPGGESGGLTLKVGSSVGSGTLPHCEQSLLKEPWLLRMGSSSRFGSLPLGLGAFPWMAASLGLGMLGIGIVLLLLWSLGSLLLPVPVLDVPATGGSPVTSWMLALQMGVCIFGGGEYQSWKGGLMIIPWEIFLLCHVATIGVVQVVRPDLVFVMRKVRGRLSACQFWYTVKN